MATTTAAIRGDREDKARGLLLGTALGDALGAPFEGHVTVVDADLAAHERDHGPLVHTDDTALTLVLATHLARRRTGSPLEEDALAWEFAQEWRAEPWRGYGPGAAEVFRLITTGVPWREATRTVFSGEGSYGNGGAMRVAPVALVGSDPHHTADLARRSAVPTHAHPHAQHGAAVQAVAALLALRSEGAHPLDGARFLEDIAQVVPSPPWHDRLARVAELTRQDAPPEHAADVLGHDATALGSVPLALLAFLRHADDPAAALRYAVLGGGDTDTIAAMTGALAGARNGAAALPGHGVRRLEAAARLRAAADGLV